MKRLVLLGSGIILTLLFGCASTKMVRTEEQRIPSATGAGALDIVLTEAAVSIWVYPTSMALITLLSHSA